MVDCGEARAEEKGGWRPLGGCPHPKQMAATVAAMAIMALPSDELRDAAPLGGLPM